MEQNAADIPPGAKSQAILLDDIGEPIIRTDMGGLVCAWNRAAAEAFGYAAETMLGTHLSRLIADGDEAFVYHHFLEPLLIRGRAMLDCPVRTQSGERRHVHFTVLPHGDASGQVVGAVITLHDISKQVATEAAHEEARQRLSFHWTQMPLAGIEWDVEGRIRAWNPAAGTIFGYTSTEAIGKEADLLATGQGVDSFKAFFETLRCSKSGNRCTMNNRRKDGQEICCEWFNSPLLDQHGAIAGFASLALDITERLKTESALKAAKESADAANRSKDQFLAVMSHEIRTPMNSIIGFADLMLDSPLDENQRDHLNIIKSNAYNLLDLINNVLKYSLLDSGKVVPEKRDCDLHYLVHEIEDYLSSELEQKGLCFEAKVGANTPGIVYTDYLELRQILMNLLGNAIKFTEKGEIELKVWTEPCSGGEKNSLELCASVRDTGVGIASDKLETIFESFSQVDSSSTRRFEGTGLGLAMSRKLCHLLGGEIGVESEPGKGSCFRIRIPVEVSGDALSASAARMPMGDMPILVGVNEPETARLLEDSLTDMGCKVKIVSSGLDVIEALQEEAYGLLVVAVDLPEMDGLEITECVRQGMAGENNRNLYICALSTYADGDDHQRCLKAGMDAHLGKPILVRNLNSVLKAARKA